MVEDARWRSLALRLVLALTALRLLWHLFTPIGILGDEAYYWEWGRHLDWGYYSKPPLIGWLYGSVGRLTGDSLYAFKATATLLTGGGLWFFFLAVRRCCGGGVAFWALAASALSIGNTLLASILTIDAPLLFFWCLALWLYTRLLFDDGKPAWGIALLLGLALGFGHLSKQMMLAFPVLMLGGAWFARRELLKAPHLYAAIVLSLAFLLPPLYWNIQNHWVTVSHTGHHFDPQPFDPAEVAGRYASLAAVTAVLLTPILFGLLLAAGWSARRWKSQPPRMKVLCLFGIIPLLGIAALGLRQEINPNWPAVFYPAAIAMTTWWCLREDTPRRAEWFRRSVALGAALTLGLMILLPFLDQIGIPAQRRGWRGYPELAEAVADQARQLPNDQIALADGNILVHGHRFTCSQLAFHLRKPRPGDDTPPRIFLWPDPDEIDSQYDFWPGPALGSSMLLVVERKNKGRTGEPSEELSSAFEELQFLAEIPLHHSRDFPTFKIYFARHLRVWPSPLGASLSP